MCVCIFRKIALRKADEVFGAILRGKQKERAAATRGFRTFPTLS